MYSMGGSIHKVDVRIAQFEDKARLTHHTNSDSSLIALRGLLGFD